MTLRSLSITRRLKARGPYVPGLPRPVIVHCSHHRSGSTWFAGIMRGLAEHFDLKLQVRQRGDAIEPGIDILCNRRPHLSLEGLTNIRGSHMIRDPRDIAVSAYHYHLWTKEEWVHVPREGFGGKTYQEFLHSLDPHEGLSAEIRRLAGSVFVHMSEWDYSRAEFLELRYEDVIADAQTWFTRLFGHYGFTEGAISEALSITDGNSFARVAGRSVGETENQKHLRSGRAGQWRDEFSSDHVALFKKRTGDLVVRLGYEQDDWW